MAFLPPFTLVGVFQGFMPAGLNRFVVPVVCMYMPLLHTHKRLRIQVQIGWSSFKFEFHRCSPSPKLREVCCANLQFVPN